MMVTLKNEMNLEKTAKLLASVDEKCDGLKCSNYRRKKIEIA